MDLTVEGERFTYGVFLESSSIPRMIYLIKSFGGPDRRGPIEKQQMMTHYYGYVIPFTLTNYVNYVSLPTDGKLRGPAGIYSIPLITCGDTFNIEA